MCRTTSSSAKGRPLRRGTWGRATSAGAIAAAWGSRAASTILARGTCRSATSTFTPPVALRVVPAPQDERGVVQAGRDALPGKPHPRQFSLGDVEIGGNAGQPGCVRHLALLISCLQAAGVCGFHSACLFPPATCPILTPAAGKSRQFVLPILGRRGMVVRNSGCHAHARRGHVAGSRIADMPTASVGMAPCSRAFRDTNTLGDCHEEERPQRRRFIWAWTWAGPKCRPRWCRSRARSSAERNAPPRGRVARNASWPPSKRPWTTCCQGRHQRRRLDGHRHRRAGGGRSRSWHRRGSAEHAVDGRGFGLALGSPRQGPHRHRQRRQLRRPGRNVARLRPQRHQRALHLRGHGHRQRFRTPAANCGAAIGNRPAKSAT